MQIGPHYRARGGCTFRVWAPLRNKVDLRILLPEERVLPMEKDARGYWWISLEDVLPGTTYRYRLDDKLERPDPASRFQPDGVHGPSGIIDPAAFRWDDGNWRGLPPEEMIIYELHVGTFSPEGTFDAVSSRLDDLKDLGINTIEFMPVAQFPGERNWGYDGTYPFAIQNSYGGPEGLQRTVNECHAKGLAVILDVVYNHLGPEGNYLRDFGPYFTSKYKTPWGDAVNFDDAFSDEVRLFFIESALHLFCDYHVDALRIDAVHGIVDTSATPFLQELAEKVDALSSLCGRRLYLIAESDLNDVRIIKPQKLGGFGIDAQWCDDYHHAVHALITNERQGYYDDFGELSHLAKALREGYVYSGQYSSFRRKRHGNSSLERPAHQFIVFSQNHDQVGNRAGGERLSSIVSFESLKLSAGIILLSPYIPLLFMGEEYGEDSPFLYFISHSDPSLIESVREGRKEEFREFMWDAKPYDPQEKETFLRSRVHWGKRTSGKHGILLAFYRQLIGLRKELPALSTPDKESLDVDENDYTKILSMRRWKNSCQIFLLLNFSKSQQETAVSLPEGLWVKILDSADERWSGPGAMLPPIIKTGDELTMPKESFALFRSTETERGK